MHELNEDTTEAEKNNVSKESISRSSERSVQNCLICYDKPPDAVFMECGHGGICY